MIPRGIKVDYQGDTAPSFGVIDGAIWFNTIDGLLYVMQNGIWIAPGVSDENEQVDTAETAYDRAMSIL